MTSTETIILLLPELILVLAGTLIYLNGAFFPNQSQPTLLALLSLGLVCITLTAQDGELLRAGEFAASFSGPLAIDLFGHTARWFILLSGLLLVLLTRRPGNDPLRAEYTGSLLMLLAGLMISARANELVLLFAGLELVSIPTYVMLYIGRRGAQAQEATTKYFYLSLLSSGLLLYGFSFLYGATGSTSLTLIGSAMLARGADFASFAGLGMLFVVAGLGFRLAAVPFHFYAPDVYQGSSQANAGLLSTMPKVAGLLVLIRLVAVNLPGIEDLAWKVLLAISLVTMTLGNILALWQSNLRRLLAYSSIAHGGYLLIGVAVGIYQQQQQRGGILAFEAGAPGMSGLGISGLGTALYYVAVYTFATLGIFAVLASLGTEDRPIDRVEELNGLSRRHLLSALALAVFLFSLAGIPPLVGFWGKFNLLLGAVQASGVTGSGPTNGWFLGLAIVTVLNAAVAAAYYLRVIAALFFREPPTQNSASPLTTNSNPGPQVAWALCLLLVLGGGLATGPLLNPSQAAGTHILGALSPISQRAARQMAASPLMPANTVSGHSPAATLAAQHADPKTGD